MSENRCTCEKDGGAPCAWCAGLPRDRAPAAPPEGVRVEPVVLQCDQCRSPDGNPQPDLGQDVVLCVLEADTLAEAIGQMADCWAKVQEQRDAAQAEAERLRGENAGLWYELAEQTMEREYASNERDYWIAEAEAWDARMSAVEADAARRVEAMREAAAKVVDEFAEDEPTCCKRTQTQIAELIRALPATPAPGPSAEDALRWAYKNHPDNRWSVRDPMPTETEYVARGLADLTRAPGGQDAR